MVRFAITVLLLVALALWNLPEFREWGRYDRNSEALAQSDQECRYQAQRVAVHDSGNNNLKSSCLSSRGF
jgi:hypothetical protein